MNMRAITHVVLFVVFHGFLLLTFIVAADNFLELVSQGPFAIKYFVKLIPLLAIVILAKYIYTKITPLNKSKLFFLMNK